MTPATELRIERMSNADIEELARHLVGVLLPLPEDADPIALYEAREARRAALLRAAAIMAEGQSADLAELAAAGVSHREISVRLQETRRPIAESTVRARLDEHRARRPAADGRGDGGTQT